MRSEPGILEKAPNTELLRSLGRLVRGLSALFWGLPLALIICVQTAKADTLRSLAFLPSMVATGWLVFGLFQLNSFQKQERVWVSALDRAKLIALVNLGLSPFLFWWNRMPDEPFYNAVVGVLAVSGLLFLSSLNVVLYRLSAMLPDESLRHETKYFTMLNQVLVLGILLLGLLFLVAPQFLASLPWLGPYLSQLNPALLSLWMLIFLVLLPLAMTMALLWKIKEVILDSVFGMSR
ncbi:MAG: hypothetical protein JWR26_2372 [Pedosphaera sp.]|nr:hypothetical protein [Pedosphaera sp.]